MAAKRKICVVTGTRAEYGHLFWLLREIDDDPELELQLIATGMHLSPEFGYTAEVIEGDGFEISARVEMLLSSETPVAIAKSMGLGTIGFADAFQRLAPDIVVMLGDRFELLAAAQAAMVARIPIAHIHGGERTEGAIDEAIRHCLTKMAQLHFVTAEPYRKRVIQLGEQPDRVFNFGAPGLDNIQKLKLLERQDFEKSIDFKLGELNFLVTYHSQTLSPVPPAEDIRELLEALDRYPEAKIIFTRQNSDTEGRVIGRMLDEYAARDQNRARIFTNLGQVRYLSAIRHVDVVIGNSSSGIIEVPAMKKATVNIGDRQKGRLRAESIIDCPVSSEAIYQAVSQALSAEFQQQLKSVKSMYGLGDSSVKIKEIIKNVSLETILKKEFFDL